MRPDLKCPAETFIKYQYRPQASPFQGSKSFWMALLTLTLMALTLVCAALLCLQRLLPEAYCQLWNAYPVPIDWRMRFRLIQQRVFWKILYICANQDPYSLLFLYVLCALPWFYLLIRHILPTLFGFLLWFAILIFNPVPLGI